MDDRICELHFDPEDVVMNIAANSDRVWRTLRPEAVPQKPTEKTKQENSQNEARRERLKRRHHVLEQVAKEKAIQVKNIPYKIYLYLY